MEVNDLKIVFFYIYCPACKHLKVPGEKEPCATCLDEPVNMNSHKPVKFEEDKKEK